MTASNLEPTSPAGECTQRDDVTERVTSPAASCEPSKRVTVSVGEGNEANDGDNNNNNQCLPREATCCHAGKQDEIVSAGGGDDDEADEQHQPEPPEIGSGHLQTQLVATHKQPYPHQLQPQPRPPPPVQPHAISIYPPAVHNYLHYPLASVAPPLGPPPLPPFQPQLSFYHQQAPFLTTWTCPITGNYHHHHHHHHHQPLLPSGHFYYTTQHLQQAQPFVAQHQHHLRHNQLGGPAVYADATTNQCVTQSSPLDRDGRANDNKCHSHGSPPINEISARNASAGIGSSASATTANAAAASFDYAHSAQQATQQSDKSSSSSAPLPRPPQPVPEQPEPLDTAALRLAACGPIPGDDKRRDRLEPLSCPQQLDKISYQSSSSSGGGGGGGGCDDDDEGSRSRLESANEVEDDGEGERGSCHSSCDDDRGEQTAADSPADRQGQLTSHELAGKSASRFHQDQNLKSITSSKCGGCCDGKDSTCSPDVNQAAAGLHDNEDQPPRVNLMVEPARGEGSSSGISSSEDKQDESGADSEEEEAEEEEEADGVDRDLPLPKEANLDEIRNIHVIDQLAPPASTTESHQISINGTTFYHVDPARIFLPPHAASPPNLVLPPQAIQYQQQQQHQQQQQMPFLMSYHNLGPPAPHVAANGTYHHQVALPTTCYSLQASPRAVSQPGPYAVAGYLHHHQQPASSHSRLTLDQLPVPSPPVSYPEWLYHTAASYHHAQHVEVLPNRHQVFASPYHAGPSRSAAISGHAPYNQAQMHTAQPVPPVALAVTTTTTTNSNTTSVSQLKLGYNLIPLLPIQAIPTRVRQAYGMDKVWQDEFEQLFAQFISQVVWTLVEVETNPNVRPSSRILDYKSRYVVRVDVGPTAELVALNASTCTGQEEEEEEEEQQQQQQQQQQTNRRQCDGSLQSDSKLEEGQGEVEDEANENQCEEDEGEECEVKSCRDQDEDDSCSLNQGQSHHQLMNERASNCESDCDSGAVLNSSTSGSSFETTCCQQSDELSNTSSSSSTSPNARSFTPMTEVGGRVQSASSQLVGARRLPLKFRMFIDSAKVRFCCETCGHGWTSMKGRVVFWYELFELVDDNRSVRSSAPFKYAYEQQQQHGVSNLIGYCAYKLFGQQCDVCKVENRFERPMWYPEEVTKVLCNLYNKIGQVYFGFRMPTIDKQRRAGKPKTSHNSLLCQACHDGVCTDRK